MFTVSRRRFLVLASSSVLAAPWLRAIEPFQRPGNARLRLGLAAYSFRDYFKNSRNPKADGAKGERDMLWFIDWCAEHGCDGAELTSYFFPKDVAPEYLRQVRRHAFLRGVSISGTAVGNTFTHPPGPERDKEIAYVKQWIDNAAILGAPHVRVFAGSAPKGVSHEDAVKNCIATLEECCEYAGKQGVFLGVENHGGIVAKPKVLLEIVRAVKSPWCGINLDTGNFHTADPYASLEMCAPYAVNVQVKAEISPEGEKERRKADLARVVKILRDAKYQGWVTLEYESKADPFEGVPPLLEELRALIDGGSAKTAGDDGWQPLFDGQKLEPWKATNFAGAGDVKVEKGQIIMEAGNDMTGINLEQPPAKMDYEVSMEAMRVEGDDFFCGFTFPVGETHVSLIVGGWAGSVVGISNVNGDAAVENETTQFKKFEKGQWYRVRVKVTKAKIEAWIDDEQMVNLETADKTLEIRAGEIENSIPFGIATWRTKSALRNLKWRPVKN